MQTLLRKEPEYNHTATWDFKPCVARRCIIIVDDDPRYPAFWARPLVGQKREVVEVVTPDNKVFIDNEDGTGWLRLTDNPNGDFREIPARAVVGYLE